MHVLQWRFVVVPQSDFVGGLDEEGVVQARVANVVADRAHEKRIPLAIVQVSLPSTNSQEPVNSMGHIDGVEPIVVRNRLDVASLGRLQKGRHDHGIEGDTVVVRAHKVHGRSVVPRLVQLEGVQVPRVEEVQGETCVLDHGLLRVEHVAVVGWRVLHLRIRILLPGVRIGGAGALEALDHCTIALSEALHGLRVHHVLVHGDLREGSELLHDLLEQLRLVAEGVAGALVVFVVAVVLVVLRVLILHRDGHVGHRLEDRGRHLAHLLQQLLQRLQDDCGDRVRQDQGEADHQDHHHQKQQDVHQTVDLVRLAEVELSHQAGTLHPDGVRRPGRWAPGRGPGQLLGDDLGELSDGLGQDHQAVGVVILLVVKASELFQLPRERLRLPNAGLLEHIQK
mmetsp:Transcript_36010/g.103469  ORF Transcript_36010/g.103469 Transcript_36010/m.103469 type:complete len:396 (+) Transcript_36010:736-1923(+)